MNGVEQLSDILGQGRGRGRGLLPLSECMKEMKAMRPPKCLPSQKRDPPSFDRRLSVDAPEFVPQVGDSKSVSDEAFAEDSCNLQDSELYFYLAALTKQPGRFTSISNKLLLSFNSTGFENAESLSFVVDAIFENCVMEPNLRYNGARLCSLLSQQLKVSFGNISFRYLLLQRCKAEFEAREKTILSDPLRLQGFALFLAELYIHVTVGEGVAAKRVQILMQPLFQLAEHFLTVPDAANIKYVNQMLKLCGAQLEDDERSASGGKSPKMDQLLSKLKTTALVAELPFYSKQLLLDIVELRASNWGRAGILTTGTRSTTSSIGPYSQKGATRAVASPGCESFPLTFEEEAFLAAENLDAVLDCSFDDADSEFDEEIEADYEKFLASLK